MTTARENAWFRGLARHRVSLAATLSHSVQGWRHDARITDLSLGGARLELSGATVDTGDRVALAVVAPTLWDPIELSARIVWQRAAPEATLVGVAFDGTADDTLVVLFDLLAALG